MNNIFLVLLFALELCLPTLCAAEIVNDVSRLNPVQVTEVIKVRSLDDIHAAIDHAREYHLPVAISAQRHSQGGHTAVQGGLVLDMSEYNKIVWMSEADKTITVQSGATWAQIQQYINSKNLALQITQSSNIFSVGGSLGANIHGRDPRLGPVIESVLSLRVVLASGNEVQASRDQNHRLFNAIIGGYGLFGVITEVTLQLTDNYWLRKMVSRLDYRDYAHYVKSFLSNKLALHYGRCSIVPDESFFRDCVVVDYLQLNTPPGISPLAQENHVARDRYVFGLSRKYEWGKSLRWWLQGLLIDRVGEEQLVTRNNAMRPPISFLQYTSNDDTDILQEYFVPLENFTAFMDQLREILLRNKVNVLNMTLRYVKANNEVYLNYAGNESIAIVLYINIKMKRQIAAELWTQEIVNAALSQRGSYYLTYQQFPSKKQFQHAYPSWKKFVRLKRRYDPETMFVNEFYKRYFE